MIRDPSDGSVREVVDEKVGNPVLKSKTPLPVNELMRSTTSGLRQPTRTDAQERLERSREWLKNYQEKHNARGNGSGEEFQKAGDSSDGEGAVKSALSGGSGDQS